MDPLVLKCTYIEGLQQFVLEELKSFKDVRIMARSTIAVYIECPPDYEISQLKSLRSVISVYLIQRDTKYNPKYISNHKSVLGSLVAWVTEGSKDTFKTYRLSCAGGDSSEVVEIRDYIQEHFKLVPVEDADLEVYIGKVEEVWEIGVRTTARPLSVRDYRVEHIQGGLNPTVAYAMNRLCRLDAVSSYLNVCSGSGILLIEAGLSNSKLKLVGFDINTKANTAAVRNIKKAGLIQSVEIKTADLKELPNLGMFDVIVADLPFGMQIGKDINLESFYSSFVDYCVARLNPGGRIVVYTTEHVLLQQLLDQSVLRITQSFDLKIVTSVQSYIYPRIMVCEFKKSL